MNISEAMNNLKHDITASVKQVSSRPLLAVTFNFIVRLTPPDLG